MTFYVFSRILNLQIHAHIYRSFIRHHKMLGVRIAKRTIEPQKPANPCGTKLCARIFFCQHTPRRSKLYIVCSDFFQKVRAHSFRCSSFSSRKRSVGLRLDEMGALDWCIFFVNIVHVGAGFVSLAPIYFISQIYVPQSENLAGSRISTAGFFFGVPLKLQDQIGTEVSLRPLLPGLYIVYRPGFVHIKAKRREKRVVFCEMRREMGNMGQAN